MLRLGLLVGFAIVMLPLRAAHGDPVRLVCYQQPNKTGSVVYVLVVDANRRTATIEKAGSAGDNPGDVVNLQLSEREYRWTSKAGQQYILDRYSGELSAYGETYVRGSYGWRTFAYCEQGEIPRQRF